MNETDQYDGPTLRQLREQVHIPLRRVARLAGMSHGHLSKVERGEHGRPVTPAILAAYEKATGLRFTHAKLVGFGDGSVDTSGAGWRRGQLSDAARRGFNARVASVAVGGPVGEPIGQMIDAVGRLVAPGQVYEPDVSAVERVAGLVTVQDLRWGGGVTSVLARTVLRWAVRLTGAEMPPEVYPRLFSAVGQLAHRAGWAAVDNETHDAARSLFTVALDAAVQANDRDLRAHVLADVAAQHNFFGYPGDALEILGVAEGDRRVGPAVRMVLAGVAARAHAAAAQVEECRQYITLAEDMHARAQQQHQEETVGGWQATVSTQAHLWAATGHAAAILARRTGRPADRSDAVDRLMRATMAFDPNTHTRMRALAAGRLALLFLDDGDREQSAHWAQQAAPAGLRSGRLTRCLRLIEGATGRAGAPRPAFAQPPSGDREGGTTPALSVVQRKDVWAEEPDDLDRRRAELTAARRPDTAA